jgi:hypothetical protein
MAETTWMPYSGLQGRGSNATLTPPPLVGNAFTVTATFTPRWSSSPVWSLVRNGVAGMAFSVDSSGNLALNTITCATNVLRGWRMTLHVTLSFGIGRVFVNGTAAPCLANLSTGVRYAIDTRWGAEFHGVSYYSRVLGADEISALAAGRTSACAITNVSFATANTGINVTGASASSTVVQPSWYAQGFPSETPAVAAPLPSSVFNLLGISASACASSYLSVSGGSAFPWVMLDLGTPATLSAVRLYPKADDSGTAESSMSVRITAGLTPLNATQSSANSLLLHNPQCGSFEGILAVSGADIPCYAVARYVTVQSVAPGNLTLCKVAPQGIASAPPVATFPLPTGSCMTLL